MKTYASVAACVLGLMLCVAGAQAQGRGGAGRGPGGSGPGGPGPGSPGGGPARGNQPPALAGAVPGGASHNALRLGPSGRWWDDKSVGHVVGITSAQQRRMDSVFDANKPAILATYKTLLAEQARLADLNKSPQPSQSAVFAQIDAVSQARAALQKATAQMLLQIRQELAPEQVQKLEQVQ